MTFLAGRKPVAIVFALAGVALILSCAKSSNDGGLLVIGVTSSKSLSEVTRLVVTVSDAPEAGAPRPYAPLTFATGDGGASITMSSLTLGVRLPATATAVVVEVDAYASGPSPIASGESAVVTLRARGSDAATNVTIPLNVVTGADAGAEAGGDGPTEAAAGDANATDDGAAGGAGTSGDAAVGDGSAAGGGGATPDAGPDASRTPDATGDVPSAEAGEAGADAHDAAPACVNTAKQCSGTTAVQTCSGGQWGPAVPCGSHQTCQVLANQAACVCTVDTACSAAGTTCSSLSTLVTCAKDPQTSCLYSTSAACTGGACTGAAGAASCCTNMCSVGATQCGSATALQTCALASNGCTAFTTATTCPTGSVCERASAAACADPNWAEWPIPSSPVDVAGGAGNPESYTDNHDGTTTDSVTGLIWQTTVAPGTYTFAGAITYCSTTLAVGTYHDWRLPTLIELVSIVDDSGTLSSSTLLPTTIAGGSFWTSTPLGETTYVNGVPQDAWGVDFSDGKSSHSTTTSTYYVRCVR